MGKGVLRCDGDKSPGHDSLDRCLPRVLARGDAPQDDVSICHHAAQLAAAANRQRADVVLCQHPGGSSHRLRRRDGDWLAAHNVFDLHIGSSCFQCMCKASITREMRCLNGLVISPAGMV